ncbi:MAG: DUF2007 domain-containing protein [Gammaproteobacteria bacterium]|nr:DUF2007 domain-containing protein [Gammaproteobacteria bacterium]
MKRVYTSANLAEATLLRHALEQAGIPTHVLNTHAAGALGEIPMADAGPQLWIAQLHQETQARALIAEFLRKKPDAAERVCTACGETNPGEFDSCWNCRAWLPQV